MANIQPQQHDQQIDSRSRTRDWVPQPDPTKLTTEQLNATVSAVKELFTQRLESFDATLHAQLDEMLRRRTEVEKMIDHLKGFIETRLDGIDRATELRQKMLDGIPDRVDEKLGSLRLLHDERFNSIQTQFRERDVRTEQSSKDSKVAVDAALQAAKEAVGEQNKSSALAIAKSETSTVKQMDQMSLLITSVSKGIDDKINDLKDRIGRIEGVGEGRSSNKIEHTTGTTTSLNIISIVVSVLAVMVVIAIAFLKHT